jgi:hypothetical protein
MRISNKPESEWDDATHALNDLYNPKQYGFKDSTYIIESGEPTSDWDADDTSEEGVKFEVGSRVMAEDTGVIYICQDNTAGAAIWNKIIQERM